MSRPVDPVEAVARGLELRLEELEALKGRRVGLATMADPYQCGGPAEPGPAEVLALYMRGRGTCEPVPAPHGAPFGLFVRMAPSQVGRVLRWRRDQVLEEDTGVGLEDLDPGQVVREALELALALTVTGERRAILEGALEGIADLEGEEVLLLDVTRCACAGCGQAARVEDYDDDDPDLCPACGDVLVPVEELEDDLEDPDGPNPWSRAVHGPAGGGDNVLELHPGGGAA